MKRRWIASGAAFTVALVLAGLLVAASGIVPITASSGHWAATFWFLDFSKRRSVALHALSTDLPPLDEPWLVEKGAAHYDSGCAPCHGTPGVPNPWIAEAMTPAPPYLPERLAQWEPAELFYIVKHGIKFTGMPAWPAQERDDEVHALVAFLLEFPTLEAREYERLAHGARVAAVATVAPQAVAASCARCHGMDGRGRGNAAFPKLAGQKPEYFVRALEAYTSSDRNSGIMEPIAAALAPEERRALAEHYARFSSEPDGAAGDAERMERGRVIAEEGIPSRGVPSCRDCHGPGGQRRNAAYPRLTGQYADYLVLQLELIKQGRRGGSAFAHLMDHVAPRLTAEEMRDVASYYASSAPDAEAEPAR